jgi:hypothetical protein
MLFILSNDFLNKLQSIRADYEREAKVELETEQTVNRFSLFLGTKDIKARNKQITFIEAWLKVLESDLHPERMLQNALIQNAADTTNEERNFGPEEDEAYSEAVMIQAIETQVAALRLLVAVCLYLKSQIDSTHSVLEQLINKALGLSSVNCMDEETRACCLLTARQYWTFKEQSEEANTLLEQKFPESQWNKFLTFIEAQCNDLPKNYPTNYPVMHTMRPFLGKSLELAGYTVGFVLGKAVGAPAKFINGKKALATALSTGLIYVIGPSATMGVMLFAPSYAGRFLDSFSGITLAWALGQAGSIAGQGIGMGLGLSLDLSRELINKSCQAICNIYSQGEEANKLSGICLINGHSFVEGVELKIIHPSRISNFEEENFVHMTIDNNILKINYNGQDISYSEEEQPPYIQELRKIISGDNELKPEANTLPSETQELSTINSFWQLEGRETALSPRS